MIYKHSIFLQILLFFVLLFTENIAAQENDNPAFHKWALTPPMGWNSWDCFGPSVVESEVKANADYMAANLKEFGWEYVVVDIRWYVDNQTTGHYNSYDNSVFIIDEYGRYLPSPTRFPSAANGEGFKPLADYVHSLGLKFGIHIMRGVPKEAVFNQLPIKKSYRTADQIYSTAYECTWLQDNYTIDANKEGAQDYYNSILDLYASWGVDFIKVDDLSRPYHSAEIEMLRKAIDQTGRPIVLSMSPGAAPLTEHVHARQNANMWRTVDDFWDNWPQLSYQFGVCANWAPYVTPGAWPDADMLPLGHIAIRGERGVDRYTNFTEDEQYTMMSLWSIFKSPLMFGGHMPDNDAFTNFLLTNDEVLYVHKNALNSREWYRDQEKIAWTADDPFTGDKFIALFNAGGADVINTSAILYRSPLVSRLTDGYGVNIDVEIPLGNDQLYLVVSDGGDGISCDHTDWINPTIYLENGDSVLLTELSWEFASAGWNTPLINKSVSGGSLNIQGTIYSNGIGTHAQSVILYNIPENTVRFKAFAGLDIGGTSQTGGATVEFLVSNTDPTSRQVNVENAVANTGRISRTLNADGVDVSADITGATKLYLVVSDAGDNFNYDHADWINPAIYTQEGDSIFLTDLTWVSATSGWATVQKNKSLDGNPLKIGGITYSNGFGVNSYSIIEYDLPVGYTTFKAFCGVDDEVLGAPNGVTVEFMVFTEDPSFYPPVAVTVDLNELGFAGECTIRNLWEKSDEGTFSNSDFAPVINSHGAGMYRISGLNRSNAIDCILSSVDEDVLPGDSLTLEIAISKTGTDTNNIAGWVHIYQNDSIIASFQVDETGEVIYKTSALMQGEYVFRASYCGNTYFNSITSNSLTYNIGVNTKLTGTTLEQKNIWVNKTGGENYLNGLKAGDQILIYNIQGQLIKSFIADSDIEVLSGEGIVLIKVKTNKSNPIIKAIL